MTGSLQEISKALCAQCRAILEKDKNYTFGLKGGNSMDLEGDLMIFENEIGIDNKGTGRQIFVKTDFALERKASRIVIEKSVAFGDKNQWNAQFD